MADEYVLYILPRKDMLSLNHAGKMAAQCAHAANHAVHSIGSGHFGPQIMAQFNKWETSTDQGFGTTIVFGEIVKSSLRVPRALSIEDIQMIVGSARASGFAAAVTHDPSYPLLDGNTMHSFPCDTAGWVFGVKKDLSGLLNNLILHSETATSF